MDETTAPVLDPGRHRTKKGFFWVMASAPGGPSPPVVLFRYAPERPSACLPHFMPLKTAQLPCLLGVRAVGRWAVQRLTFAVSSFLVVIVLLRNLRSPARAPRDHGSFALFFPRANHSLAKARLRRPVLRQRDLEGLSGRIFHVPPPYKVACGNARQTRHGNGEDRCQVGGCCFADRRCVSEFQRGSHGFSPFAFLGGREFSPSVETNGTIRRFRKWNWTRLLAPLRGRQFGKHRLGALRKVPELLP